MGITSSAWSLPVLMIVLSCLTALIPPRMIGFYCNDPNINHKFSTDTFPSSLLIFLMIVPMMVLLHYCEGEHLKAKNGDQSEDELKVAIRTRGWLLYARYWILTGVAFLTNEFLKITFPEARPHFMETCNPDWSKIKCDATNQYVSFDVTTCMDPNSARNGAPKAVYDGMKSFPSGHAQMSCYSSLVAILYILKRYPPYSNKWTKYFLIVLFSVLAFLASVTRITDRRHHWWDVAFGSSLGLIEGYIVFKLISQHIQELDSVDKGSSGREISTS